MSATCSFSKCKAAADEVLLKCDACLVRSIHDSCCQPLKVISNNHNSFIFCSTNCAETSPAVINPKVKELMKSTRKDCLKSFLRSKDIIVVDESKKDFSKEKLVSIFMDYAESIIVERNLQRSSGQKGKNDDVRLLNILFHDDFADDFAKEGKTKTRMELDARGGATGVTFWDRVAEAYNDIGNDWDDLQFDHAVFEGLDPFNFVNHDAKKLKNMWKELNSHYKAALCNYTKSGNHNPEFMEAIQRGEEEDDFVCKCRWFIIITMYIICLTLT